MAFIQDSIAPALVLARRGFMVLVAGGLSGACVTGDRMASPSGRIPLRGRLVPVGDARARPAPHLLSIGSTSYSTFQGHVSRPAAGGVTAGGIDYAPLPGHDPTAVCPVAAGVVIASSPHSGYCGVRLVVGHGLGWKSEYCHLQSRGARYGDPVRRGQSIALMGASGTGASRVEIGGPVVHLHLALWGPAWTPLYEGIDVQRSTNQAGPFAFRLDPEQFSVAGIDTLLPYTRATDRTMDERFLAVHAQAVRRCDELLDQLGDAEAAGIKARDRFEQETRFDYNVDQRLWYLWQRLERGAHAFGAEPARDHRAALLSFMETLPRLTSPLVERGTAR